MADVDDPFDLERFLDAQAHDYGMALAELRNGEKQSHWMWFIFPQLRGLGRSSNAYTYGITGLEEARAYLAHRVLGVRLRECVATLVALGGGDAAEVLGDIDAMKLRSCLTLFCEAAPQDPLFARALDQYFGGERDAQTLKLLQGAGR